jgi:predicted enzyme related to lactoylglutathione lyase
MVTDGGEGIGGGVGTAPQPHACWYVEVPDPQAHLDKVASLGGTVVMPAANLGMVTVGMFTDPEGGLVGLYKSNQ